MRRLLLLLAILFSFSVVLSNNEYQDAIDLIKKSEGLKLEAYYDPVGVPTIGYGKTGEDVFIGQTITKEEAEKFLIDKVFEINRYINTYVKVPINANQRNALISFIYNLGVGNFRESTLLKKLNEGDYIGASQEFKRWKYAGGKVLNGLVIRREREEKLFNKKIEEKKVVNPIVLVISLLLLISIVVNIVQSIAIFKLLRIHETEGDDIEWWS